MPSQPQSHATVARPEYRSTWKGGHMRVSLRWSLPDGVADAVLDVDPDASNFLDAVADQIEELGLDTERCA